LQPSSIGVFELDLSSLITPSLNSSEFKESFIALKAVASSLSVISLPFSVNLSFTLMIAGISISSILPFVFTVAVKTPALLLRLVFTDVLFDETKFKSFVFTSTLVASMIEARAFMVFELRLISFANSVLVARL